MLGDNGLSPPPPGNLINPAAAQGAALRPAAVLHSGTRSRVGERTAATQERPIRAR